MQISPDLRRAGAATMWRYICMFFALNERMTFLLHCNLWRALNVENILTFQVFYDDDFTFYRRVKIVYH